MKKKGNPCRTDVWQGLLMLSGYVCRELIMDG